MAGLFAEPDFRRLWLAGAISSAVRWLDALAFSIVAYQQSGSAFVVAMLLMLRLLPMGLFGAFVGAVAERVQPHLVLMGVVLLLAGTAVLLALLSATGQLAVWHLAVASFLNGLGWMTDSTVRRLTLAEVVGGARVNAAASFDSASANACRMLGPTAGGVLLASIGITSAFALGAALYVVAAVAMAGMRFRRPLLPAGGPGVLVRILSGVAVLRRDPRLVGVVLITLIFNLWGWPSTSMVAVLAQGRLGLGTEATGLLVSTEGLGALLASLLLGGARPGTHARLFVGGVLLYFAMELMLAGATTPWLAGFAVAMCGAATAAFGVMQTTLIFLATPVDMRSRVFGVLTACIGLGPLGFVHIGLLADWLGAPWATAICGAEGLLAMALTWRWWRVLLIRAA
jgi:MFS family permease